MGSRLPSAKDVLIIAASRDEGAAATPFHPFRPSAPVPLPGSRNSKAGSERKAVHAGCGSCAAVKE
jgi:hypothetical protein